MEEYLKDMLDLGIKVKMKTTSFKNNIPVSSREVEFDKYSEKNINYIKN